MEPLPRASSPDRGSRRGRGVPILQRTRGLPDAGRPNPGGGFPGATRIGPVFREDGTFDEAFGPSGSGPGEISNLTRLGLYRGDSIAVYDASAGRLSVFDAQGRLGRTQPIRIPEDQSMGGGSVRLFAMGSVVGFLDDGSLVLQPMTGLAGEPGERVRPDVRYLVYTPDAEPRDTVGPFPSGEFTLPNPGSGLPPLSPAFPRRTVTAFHEKRVFIGTGGDHEIRVHAADGSLERIHRATHRDLSLDDAAHEAFRAAQLENAETEEQRRDIERALRDVRFPSTVAPYVRLVVDEEGHLWTRNDRIPGSEGPDRWQVFHPEGRLLGEVETPQRLNVQQIGTDFVLGTWTDDLNVPYVRLYALRREGA